MSIQEQLEIWRQNRKNNKISSEILNNEELGNINVEEMLFTENNKLEDELKSFAEIYEKIVVDSDRKNDISSKEDLEDIDNSSFLNITPKPSLELKTKKKEEDNDEDVDSTLETSKPGEKASFEVGGCEFFMFAGNKHSMNGPAVILRDKNGQIVSEEYWINGQQVSESDFLEETKDQQEKAQGIPTLNRTKAQREMEENPESAIHMICYGNENMLHNDSGPAMIIKNAKTNETIQEEYWLNGRQVDKDDVLGTGDEEDFEHIEEDTSCKTIRV